MLFLNRLEFLEKSWREDCCALVPGELFVASAGGDARAEPAKDARVVIEDREAADGDGEVIGEEFEPGFDPSLAERDALAAEDDLPDTAGNAVVGSSE